MQEEQRQVLWFCHECWHRGSVTKTGKNGVLAKIRKDHEKVMPRCMRPDNMTYVCDMSALSELERKEAQRYKFVA